MYNATRDRRASAILWSHWKGKTSTVSNSISLASVLVAGASRSFVLRWLCFGHFGMSNNPWSLSKGHFGMSNNPWALSKGHCLSVAYWSSSTRCYCYVTDVCHLCNIDISLSLGETEDSFVAEDCWLSKRTSFFAQHVTGSTSKQSGPPTQLVFSSCRICSFKEWRLHVICKHVDEMVGCTCWHNARNGRFRRYNNM